MHLSSTRVTAQLAARWCAKGQQQKFCRVAKMQPGGGTVKDRVMHVSSALEKYFCENPEVDALYRVSNGGYLPGPAESVSIALVDGNSPSDFRNRVRTELTYVEGWKKQPNAVLRRMIDQAEAWKIVEAHGSSSGSSGGAARSGAHQEKKHSAKGLTCHKCGEIGHIQRNCHKGRSQGSAQSADGRFCSGR